MFTVRNFPSSWTQRLASLLRMRCFLYPAYLLLLSLLLYVLTDVPDILQEEWHADDDSFALMNFLFVMGFYGVLLDLFFRWKYVGWLIWLPFMLFQGVRVYMYHAMGLKMIQNHVAVFMETNWKEASAYVSWTNVGILAAFLAISALLYRVGRRLLPRVSLWGHLGIILAELLALYALVSVLCTRSTRHFCLPLRSALVVGYRAQMIIENGGAPELVHLRRIPTADVGESSCRQSPKPLTIIYVIGESVRADHLQLNGYHRATTPLLQQRKERGELLSFADVTSYGTGTYEAMLGLLTNATNEQRDPSVGSFVPLFRKHGYEASVVTNIPKGSVPTFAKLTESCDHFLYYESEYCGQLLEYMKGLRASAALVPQLVLIQTNGSHYGYYQRYPHDKPATFTPDEGARLSSSDERLVNSYDNSIVYTDYMLDAVISLYEDTSAVVIYCSDHGESFGEGGRFLHLGPLTAMEQRRVPLIVWGSEQFRREYAQLWQNMAQRTSDSLQQGNLFHTILSLGGIDSVWKRRDMDLTQPK